MNYHNKEKVKSKDSDDNLASISNILKNSKVLQILEHFEIELAIFIRKLNPEKALR